MALVKLVGISSVLFISFSLVSCQTSASTQAVSFCPLYLVLQNRCPTPSTTVGTSTPRPTQSGEDNNSNETDVADSCGSPMITFCPASAAFVSGNRNCTSGQTIQISFTTLGRLLVEPSQSRAARIVGANNVESLGESLSSISKRVQGTSTPTQATVGVTFIPVGQLIGGRK